MSSSSQPPSRGTAFFIASAVFALLALVGFVLVLFKGVTHLTDSLIQVPLPGTKVVILDEPGECTIFHEFHSNLGPSTTPEQAAAIELSVLGPAGESIVVQPSKMNSTYQASGREGRSVAQFQAPQSGSYTISGKYRDADTGPVTFALDNGFLKKILIVIFGCFLALGLPAMLSTICLIIGFVKRAKSRKPQLAPDQENLF